MRCLGRTRTLRRCQNSARLFFCYHHKRQPLSWLLLLATLVGLSAGLYRDLWEPLFSPRSQLQPETASLVLDLSKEFAGKSEADLRRELGFSEMLTTNLAWLLSVTDNDPKQDSFNASELLVPGTRMLILRGGVGTVNLRTGEFRPHYAERFPRYLILPPQHDARLAKLREYEDSPFLPKEIGLALGHYMDAVQRNALLLGEVLEEYFATLNGEQNTKSDSSDSVLWVNNRYAQRFIPLRPLAEAILDEISREAGNLQP